ILSYSDSPTIRKWYKDFEIIELPIYYTMGQEETRIRINGKIKNTNHIKKTQELLIIKEG
ncbi:MAG: DNA adenine methylase, partial [Brevinematia bacterium]